MKIWFFFQPVYSIESAELTANESGTLQTDHSTKLLVHSSSNKNDFKEMPVKEVIKKRAEELPAKIFKHKFTFKDSNFVSILALVKGLKSESCFRSI